ncbi:MAG: hypothetical protein JRH20_31565, partial [Deltaproteobacteria bacterium]|nr:hypothetical protein [Deltaproteobacteria bacterium]
MQPSAPTMKQKVLLIAISLAICLFAVVGAYVFNRFVHQTFVTHNAPKQSMRLFTWNVGKIYLPWESRASNRDVEHIARVIRRINPHVVALQEIRNREQLGRLLVKLGPGWRGRLAEDNYDRRAALLSRLRTRFFELPTTSGRIAQAGEVTLPAQKGTLFVVSLHLDAFDAGRRLAQAEEMLARLQRERP